MSHLPAGLTRHCIDTPDHPDFGAVYDLYSHVFPIDCQRESRDNFEHTLARNEEPKFRRTHSRSIWTYLKDDRGAIVAANNSFVFPDNRAPGFHGTMQTYYSFIHPDHMGKGLFVPLNKERYRVARDYIRRIHPDTPGKLGLPIIAEQNDPFRMTARMFEEDTLASGGKTPVMRRKIYERAGYRTLDMYYIQPRLSTLQEPCYCLDVIVRVPLEIRALPARLIANHFGQFFAHGFPAGTHLNDPNFKEMAQSLEGRTMIALLPGGHYHDLLPYLDKDIVASLAEDEKDMPLRYALPEVYAHFSKAPSLSHPPHTIIQQSEAMIYPHRSASLELQSKRHGF